MVIKIFKGNEAGSRRYARPRLHKLNGSDVGSRRSPSLPQQLVLRLDDRFFRTQQSVEQQQPLPPTAGGGRQPPLPLPPGEEEEDGRGMLIILRF